MSKLKYDWKYGENGHQKYYDVTVGKDYLCVFANNWNPNTWLGSYNSVCIHNKTKNDRVRKKYGLPKEYTDEEVLTIGDQDNDIELLKAGGIRVAMGNGTEGVKKEADFITDTVDNDGFVKAMEKFVLGDIKCSK